ncbi:uncharacterized protein LOC116248429 isoform X1 [Nymphaea colorata]|nr:uncharacterized protein LOC116248429 isoform X1 [Nymphaea colorata]
MNNALKISTSHIHHLQVVSLGNRAAHIHSTAVLERRRRTQWDSRCNNYSKRFRKMEAKRTLLRNVSAYAEYLFQGMCGSSRHDEDKSTQRQLHILIFGALCYAELLMTSSWNTTDDPRDYSRSGTTSSWYKRAFIGGANKAKWSRGPEESPWESYRRNKKGGFQFCSDEDEEVENIFRYAFSGNRCFYWSFTREEGSNESSHWRNFSDHYHRRSWNWRYGAHDSNESYAEGNFTRSDSVSDRLILGLNASGPLKLEDVKSAYRSCALRWHPDRHQGSSKAVAEEKFKDCSAAYKSLCEKLAMA